jgi:hypothetical protein
MTTTLPLRQEVGELSIRNVQTSINIYLEDLAIHCENLAELLDKMVTIAQESWDMANNAYGPHRMIVVENIADKAGQILTLHPQIITQMVHLLSKSIITSDHYQQLSELLVDSDEDTAIFSALSAAAAASHMKGIGERQSQVLFQTAEILTKMTQAIIELSHYSPSREVLMKMRIIETVVEGYKAFATTARRNATDYRAEIKLLA